MKDQNLLFKLYEHTVQSPAWHVTYLSQFHTHLTGREAFKFREDFCGTAKISCEWVRRNPRNSALGLDLDPVPLKYGKDVNLESLSKEQRKRIKLTRSDVRKVTTEKFDMIGAYNFSAFVFHTRAEMLSYAKAAYKSLGRRGTFFLEIAGGEGFIESSRESRTATLRDVGKVKQVWEQHQYDPITQVSDYSIHFRVGDAKTGGGKERWYQNAFTYNWRIWGIRDLREVMEEAGFQKTVVLWDKMETTRAGQAESGDYVPCEEAERHHSWIAFVVGVKGLYKPD